MAKKRDRIDRKGKRKMTAWIIVLAVVVVLGAGAGVGWTFVSKEHKQAMNLPISTIDFGHLKDGMYIGEYEGGMYKWRVNKVQVTIAGGKVTSIKLVGSSDPGRANAQADVLYDRVMQKQSLQVDVVSGSTLTSKAYLKAVENALKQAQM